MNGRTIDSYMKKHWLLFTVVFLGIFIAAYWIPLKSMVNTWVTNGDYSYGFVIPFISAYILWDKRNEIKKIHLESSWNALPILIFFVLLSLYGILGSSGNISMPSIPILIILFCAFCLGWSSLKELAVPLGFLIFMVPIPSSIEGSLGLFLKNISTKMGGSIIRMLNIPVNVNGNVIDLGVLQLQVVDACNGLRYLFPLFALGVAYSYFFEKVLWKRIFVVLSTIPIAVLTNGIRIGATGILSERFGAGIAEGFFHGFSGWALFMFAFVCLIIISRILSLFKDKIKTGEEKVSSDQENSSSLPSGRTGKINPAFYTSIGLLAMVGILSFSTSVLPAVNIKGGIESFPTSFSGWGGEQQLVTQEIIEKSGAEEAFSASYRNTKQDYISLYMGYRSTAFLSNENFFHSPTVCLPASGWTITSDTIHTLSDVPQFGELKVRQLIMEAMGEKQLVYYWFQTKNKETPSKTINRFHLALHALKRDNTHDLFIRPITPISKNETVEAAQTRMDGFVRDMMGELNKFLAEKQVVGR
jgi:exosortase D (VPLPA-CTERM-specific)